MTFEVQPPKPYDQLSALEQAQWDQQWRKTYRSYGCPIKPDGSFRIDDVPSGTYKLEAGIDEDFVETYAQGSSLAFRQLGGVTRTVTVPQIPGGRSRTDELLDLGALPFEFNRGPKVGELAPDIQATRLDDETPLKLSDYRGKFVLLVFWSSSKTLNRPESVTLKSVSSVFGNRDNFVMLGINCDSWGRDDAIARVAEYRWNWLQGKPANHSLWTLRQQYGAYDLPSIWLIGRGGKVIAADLKGAAIKEAVERAIQAE
jgi:peroxiredoxin